MTKGLSTTALNQFSIIFSRVGVTYKMGFGMDYWIYCTVYIQTVRDYRQYSSIAIVHTLQYTFHTH
jgi:hypothetical protein